MVEANEAVLGYTDMAHRCLFGTIVRAASSTTKSSAFTILDPCIQDDRTPICKRRTVQELLRMMGVGFVVDRTEVVPSSVHGAAAGVPSYNGLRLVKVDCSQRLALMNITRIDASCSQLSFVLKASV